MYIYELPNWPHFTWDHEKIYALLSPLRRQQGRLIGRMESLGFQFREQAVLQTLTQDVLKSSEIEGEILDTKQVRSSIALLALTSARCNKESDQYNTLKKKVVIPRFRENRF